MVCVPPTLPFTAAHPSRSPPIAHCCSTASPRTRMQGPKQVGAAALRASLSVFFGRCLSALAKQQPAPSQRQQQPALSQQQQQQQQQHCCPAFQAPSPTPCTAFVLLVLQQVGCTAQRSATAALLLQALAEACKCAASCAAMPVQFRGSCPGRTSCAQQPEFPGTRPQDSPPPNSSMPCPVRLAQALPQLVMGRAHLHAHVLPLLQRLHFLRPAWLCGQARGALLRVVAAASPGPAALYSGAVAGVVAPTGDEPAAAGAGGAAGGAGGAQAGDEDSSCARDQIGVEDVLAMMAACAHEDMGDPPALPLLPEGVCRCAFWGRGCRAGIRMRVCGCSCVYAFVFANICT